MYIHGGLIVYCESSDPFQSPLHTKVVKVVHIHYYSTDQMQGIRPM